MRYIISYTLLLLFILSGLPVNAQSNNPDILPPHAKHSRVCKPLDHTVLPPSMDDWDYKPTLELTLENLYDILEKYEVKHPKIVAAQALLETGHFSSDLCHNAHNLFGLRHPSDGSYYTFDSWEESVKAYRDDVQYKYSGGDYYAFLRRIGYAEDKRYTAKVKRIAQTL